MKQRTIFWHVIPLVGIGLFLCFPGPAQAGVRTGLELCGNALIPSLFPVSVLTGCLIRMRATGGSTRWSGRTMQQLFGLPGQSAVPLLLGLLGGFPLGAQLSASACEAGLLTKREAARLAGLSCNAGPAFLLGTLSAILGVSSIGVALLVIQFLAAGLTGFLLRKPVTQKQQLPKRIVSPSVSFAAVLPRCISESAAAMLRLAGTVAFFQALVSCMTAVLPISALPPLWQAGISGSLELTGALALLQGEISPAMLPLLSALIGWGGFCVHLQAAQALSASGIPIGPYLRQKAIQAGISFILSFFFFSI